VTQWWAEKITTAAVVADLIFRINFFSQKRNIKKNIASHNNNGKLHLTRREMIPQNARSFSLEFEAVKIFSERVNIKGE
jgi:hypothetical protein